MRNSEMCKAYWESLLQRITDGGRERNSSGAYVSCSNLIFKDNQTYVKVTKF